MKTCFLCCLMCTVFGVQAQKPDWSRTKAIGALQPDSTKRFTILMYGALGCGYSQYLLPHMHRFANCNEANVVVLLDDARSSVLQQRPQLGDSLIVYSNNELSHQFKKDNDIFPQLMVFEGDALRYKVKGIKKEMIVQSRKLAGCPPAD